MKQRGGGEKDVGAIFVKNKTKHEFGRALQDPMWPVEKRLAAKLLYLWDHWHVAPPQFHPHGGVYVGSVSVTLEAGSKGKEWRGGEAVLYSFLLLDRVDYL